MTHANLKFFFDYAQVTALYASIDKHNNLLGLIFEVDPVNGNIVRKDLKHYLRNGKLYVTSDNYIVMRGSSKFRFLTNFPSDELDRIAPVTNLYHRSQDFKQRMIYYKKEIFNYFYKIEKNKYFYLLCKHV